MSPLTKYFIPAVNKGMTNGEKLMLVLHGRGDTLHSYKMFVAELNVTGLNYQLLNAPFVEGFGYTWYDDSFSTQDLRYKKSMELLQQTLLELYEQYSSCDIFLFGFSQGGRMVMDLFLKENKAFAGVVALSPRVTKHDDETFSQLSKNARETPFFVGHGEEDPVIPFSETKSLAGPFLEGSKNSVFRSYPMGHEIDIFEIGELRQWMNEQL